MPVTTAAEPQSLTAPEPRSLRDLARSTARLVVYAYPAIGAPDREPITSDWKSIPGASGCTPESCGFRDLADTLGELDAGVCGLSTQPAGEQEEAAQRLALGFPLLSDRDHAITGELGLPAWSAGGPGGPSLLKRFTLATDGTVIQHVSPRCPTRRRMPPTSSPGSARTPDRPESAARGRRLRRRYCQQFD